MSFDKSAWKNGFKDAFPVFVSYVMVGFAIGITAKNAGFSPFQAGLLSALTHTSAGEAAGIEIIKEHGGLLEIIVSQIAVNLRYLLMSTALTVRMKGDESVFSRALMALGVTDENFGLSITQKIPLSPYYTFGCFCFSMPGWALGTYLGALLGNVLPQSILSAFSIGLYAMFISIVITPASKKPVIGLLAVVSMLMSYLFYVLLPSVSFGVKVIILTVGLGCIAASIWPVKEDEDE